MPQKTSDQVEISYIALYLSTTLLHHQMVLTSFYASNYGIYVTKISPKTDEKSEINKKKSGFICLAKKGKEVHCFDFYMITTHFTQL